MSIPADQLSWQCCSTRCWSFPSRKKDEQISGHAQSGQSVHQAHVWTLTHCLLSAFCQKKTPFDFIFIRKDVDPFLHPFLQLLDLVLQFWRAYIELTLRSFKCPQPHLIHCYRKYIQIYKDSIRWSPRLCVWRKLTFYLQWTLFMVKSEQKRNELLTRPDPAKGEAWESRVDGVLLSARPCHTTFSANSDSAPDQPISSWRGECSERRQGTLHERRTSDKVSTTWSMIILFNLLSANLKELSWHLDRILK